MTWLDAVSPSAGPERCCIQCGKRTEAPGTPRRSTAGTGEALQVLSMCLCVSNLRLRLRLVCVQQTSPQHSRYTEALRVLSICVSVCV